MDFGDFPCVLRPLRELGPPHKAQRRCFAGTSASCRIKMWRPARRDWSVVVAGSRDLPICIAHYVAAQKGWDTRRLQLLALAPHLPKEGKCRPELICGPPARSLG